ncbi:MAG: methylenetetrahydrofolate reductase C-terminal domain-containing protein [Anaerolineaceae bacterium]|nr:methylenetetrahydrofolate reductase C-terminal domain-containing protein [Anaerolineaceae bacterium]
MPILTPGRRWQPAYSAFRNEEFSRKFLAKLELIIKGPLFGCRMCGNCLLQETAFICSMECPKGLRNGPCGGSTEVCYVDPTRPCIWYKIFERAYNMGREEMLLEVLPPIDWSMVGSDLWVDLVKKGLDVGLGNVINSIIKKEGGSRIAFTEENVFIPIRQPEWWQGDKKYHAPAYEEPVSNLEAQLKSGKFVVATEITPPLSTATRKLREEINLLKDYAAAINFTDGASATPRMSSEACSQIALQEGAEPVLQIAARDVTRASLQSKVIGTNALGIRNILVITGDSPTIGPKPQARLDVFDMDSVQMLWLLRRMRDEGKYLDGRNIKYPPKLFLGAAASPLASKPEYQAIREHKKVNAGAQFFQTNVIFEIEGLETWLNLLAKRDILDKVYILVGVNMMKSLRMARYMHDKIPGVTIPDHVMKRLEDAGDGVEEEGFQITLEMIEKLKKIKEISGVHVMPVGREKDVPRLLKEAGLA